MDRLSLLIVIIVFLCDGFDELPVRFAFMS
jgi:hypothetical protein